MGKLLSGSLAAALFLLFSFSGMAVAQEAESGSIVITLPGSLDPDEREVLIDALEALERPVAVREDAQEVASGAGAANGTITSSMRRWDAALAARRELPGLIGSWWNDLSPRDGAGASFLVLVAIAAALLLGAGLEWLLDRVLERWRRPCVEAEPARFSGRVVFSLAWVGLELLGIAVFATGVLLLGWLFLPSMPTPRLTLAVVVAAIVKARLVLNLVRLILGPYRPKLRLAPMPDDDSRLVWRWVLISVSLFAAANGIRDIMLSAGATRDSVALLGIAVAVVAAVVRLVAIFRIREPVRRLILRHYAPKNGEPSAFVQSFASLWHAVFTVLVLFDFAGTSYAELSAAEAHFASLAVGSFLVLTVAPFAIGGYGALIDDLLLSHGAGGRFYGAAGALKAFGQGLILLVCFIVLARGWGSDPFAGADGGLLSQLAAAVLQIGGAALLGWTVWQGSKLALDHYAAIEEDGEEASDDAMGKPGSRIATILPVLRAFLFVAIMTISVLMALSAMGVNIGPLLAGAGVVGLAVGFGAQTLVKDIITGLFYLVEDAFRKGEYVQCSAGKGVVEKISMRSVQLRHHNGPLHTIPFGSMGNITNHSRDWVRIKIKIRVPFDTDLDRMRKAIKKVGQDMLEDADLGPKFLQPIKSQGAVDTDESGFITSVKFMSRPGEQFILRREAFARIQKAFQENGIEFASPRVTVDSEDEAEAVTGAGTSAAAAKVAAAAVKRE